MATKNSQNAQPVVTMVGSPKAEFTLYAEADSPGNGSLMSEPMDSPRNMAKGNLGYKQMAPPIAVGRTPFVIEED
jgi:hypothetical protein